MPDKTQEAVNWALEQVISGPYGQYLVTMDTPIELVDKVREYFNKHGIPYTTFSFYDLTPFF